MTQASRHGNEGTSVSTTVCIKTTYRSYLGICAQPVVKKAKLKKPSPAIDRRILREPHARGVKKGK